MGVLSWIVLGVVAGWVASQITRRTALKNYLANSVAGVIGAFAGGFTANLVGRDPVLGFTLISFFVAVLGTVVFLSIFSALQPR
ncbi:MAG: GlsB/YeaQ/YmgE family stress response membrane protein [Chloroflexi bacterium]|nr:GlsB/YeaQ/YmgE family stress response membrane protein [Chloroflexota bacterium]MCI0575750.1 GlsB/YeaQ/YmgE family stress response membrane protein [Chloroflexota bacterium]MCI0643643.1 GlsB/YeaQ/YmgE family stress response membrane protein [Chloroflexota bacterium]MCI0729816.1 GlsB/YeaQ/YmgE family stress response membrane protein [Chloroflexota bacterium]